MTLQCATNIVLIVLGTGCLLRVVESGTRADLKLLFSGMSERDEWVHLLKAHNVPESRIIDLASQGG